MTNILNKLTGPAADPTPQSPTAGAVAVARRNAGLTQSQAAEMVHLGSFQRWSEHERGLTPMDPARWELFLIKIGKHPLYKPAAGVPVPRAAVNREQNGEQ